MAVKSDYQEIANLNRMLVEKKISPREHYKNLMKIYGRRNEWGKISVDYDIDDYDIREACKRLDLSDDVFLKAKEMRDRILSETSPSLIGCIPRIFLSGLVFISAKECGEEISLNKIHERLGSTQASVRKAAEKISEWL